MAISYTIYHYVSMLRLNVHSGVVRTMETVNTVLSALWNAFVDAVPEAVLVADALHGNSPTNQKRFQVLYPEKGKPENGHIEI